VSPVIVGAPVIEDEVSPPSIVTVGGDEYTWMLAIVIAPARDIARPFTVEPAPIPIAVVVIIVPTNIDVAPTEPAPLTCQNTLWARAPLMSSIEVSAPSASAPLTWKTNTASGSPSASIVNTPAAAIPDAAAAV